MIRISRGVARFNIQIGPLADALKHNAAAIVSVTDHFDPTLVQVPQTYWVPIHERAHSWGYVPFFAAKKLLDVLCLDLKLPLVYLCCSGGKNRSPMTAFCWLLSQGLTPEDADKEFIGKFDKPLLEAYTKSRNLGHIPDGLPKLYDHMDRNPDWSLGTILKSLGLSETITYSGGIKL